MNIQDDYLLRMIHQLGLALRRILAGDDAGPELFDEMSSQMLGLSGPMMDQLGADRIATIARRARVPEGFSLATCALRLKVAAQATTGPLREQRLDKATTLLEAALLLDARIEGIDLRRELAEMKAHRA